MPPEAETQTEQKPAEGAPPPEKTLTQSEVNAILARERSVSYTHLRAHETN